MDSMDSVDGPAFGKKQQMGFAWIPAFAGMTAIVAELVGTAHLGAK